MNDQPSLSLQMMNQPPPPPPMMSQQQQIMSQNQVMNPVQLNQNHPPATAVLVQSAGMNQQQQPTMMMMNQRSYKPWKQQQFNNNNNVSNFIPSKSRTNNNNNWKGKNVNAKDPRRMENPNLAISSSGPSGYKPPSLNDLQKQNRMKARKYYHPKKKFNNNNNRFAPYAPRNTTSFIIRAKKAGGIASLVSPCPVTPAVLPTPIFSPSREVLGDMAKEEWGVDGYGSMKGLIRLRSPGNDADIHDEDDDDEGNGSSESDVEEHVEVERRLDHDLSRFEMIYPTYGGVGGGGDYSYNNILENRVDDQDTHITQLEEENLTLKERLFLMERELGDLRRRMQFLERQQCGQGSCVMTVVEDVNEEVVENVSENDENESGGGSADIAATGDENNDEVMEYVDGSGDGRNVSSNVKGSHDVCMEENLPNRGETVKDDELKNKDARGDFVVKDEGNVKEEDMKGEETRNEVVREEPISKEESLKKDDLSDKIV